MCIEWLVRKNVASMQDQSMKVKCGVKGYSGMRLDNHDKTTKDVTKNSVEKYSRHTDLMILAAMHTPAAAALVI